MLTDQDIQKLMAVFPTKEEVANKEDIAIIRKDFSDFGFIKLLTRLVYN